MDELGGRPAPGAVYVGSKRHVPLICSAGHECAPMPESLKKGWGLCAVCAGMDSATAAKAFWDRVAELGAHAVPGAVYVNNKTPVRLVCSAGHDCAPRPDSVRLGQPLCLSCTGRSAATEAAFWVRVRELGGRPGPGAAYAGNHVPVSLICPRGHECWPRPMGVLSGKGLCRACTATYDRVYLLWHPTADAVKVGVSGNAARVRNHMGHGYFGLAQWHNLTHQAALDAERRVIVAWRKHQFPEVATAPKDGRTETAPVSGALLARTVLTDLLGDPQESSTPMPTAS